MKKIVKKIGNSHGLIFNKEEMKTEGLKQDDIVDVKIKIIKHKEVQK